MSHRCDRRFERSTRMKGDHAAGRNRHFLSGAGVTPPARALIEYLKRAKAGDDDGFPALKGAFQERNNPLKYPGRLVLRDPGLLMNARGNIGLSHLV